MAELGNVIVVHSEANWKELIEGSNNDKKVVIVDFTATWCPPCRRIGPVFVDYSKEFPSMVFLKVDVDELQEVAASCGVEAMPTFQVFRDGVKVDELVGADKAELLEMIRKYA